jgi:HK97 gp10 family phage protein
MVQKAISVKINVKGFEKFNKKMIQALKTGLAKASFAVERKSKIYSPVDTGTLRRSIKAEKVKGEIDGYTVTISPSVAYAGYVEFGRGKPRKQGRIPFMRPALKDSIVEIKNAIFGELRRIK